MPRSVRRPARLRGIIRVPGDKSISHRAGILNAIASGPAKVRRFLPAQDCLSTLDCLRALGVGWQLDRESEDEAMLTIEGAGLHGLHEPETVLDAGNSGTTLRLLSGLLAGQPFLSILTGDASLRTRPVDRIVEPLRLMGARLEARGDGCYPPVAVRGGGLQGVHYRLPVASAQVKSAVLLAGLFAEGETVVEESAPTRDHTERMLSAMGAGLRREGPGIRLQPGSKLSPLDLTVPGDLSSAAFWLVAACLHPDAELSLVDMGINQTRSGVLDVLRMMGADVYVGEQRAAGEEPMADVTVRSSKLRGVEIGGELIPRLIDELPALAVAAAFADGATVVRGAEELRVKESDRISAIVGALGRMGAQVEEHPDGFTITGGRMLRGTAVDGGGDHRLTMALAIAGLVAEGETVIADPDSVGVSYPGFWKDVDRVSEK